MIGLDTNVILRALLDDDEGQSPRARRLIETADAERPVFINPVVLAEVVWVLREVYEVPAARIAAIVRSMIESSSYAFPDRPLILRVLEAFEAGNGSFTDTLIAELNAAHGAAPTYTFDKRAIRQQSFAAVP